MCRCSLIGMRVCETLDQRCGAMRCGASRSGLGAEPTYPAGHSPRPLAGHAAESTFSSIKLLRFGASADAVGSMLAESDMRRLTGL